MTDLINSGSGNSSTGEDNPLINSPFGPLSEVLSDEDFSNIFSGLGDGEASGTPFASNPFDGDNFWNIFAGGVNPSEVGANQGSDPLTGVGSGEIPFDISQIPSFGSGEIPFDISQIPSFGSGEIAFDISQVPSFGSGQITFG